MRYGLSNRKSVEIRTNPYGNRLETLLYSVQEHTSCIDHAICLTTAEMPELARVNRLLLKLVAVL